MRRGFASKWFGRDAATRMAWERRALHVSTVSRVTTSSGSRLGAWYGSGCLQRELDKVAMHHIMSTVQRLEATLAIHLDFITSKSFLCGLQTWRGRWSGRLGTLLSATVRWPGCRWQAGRRADELASVGIYCIGYHAGDGPSKVNWEGDGCN